MKRIVQSAAFAAVLAFPAVAEGWRLDLGAGAQYGQTFNGSGETDISFVPAVELAYAGGWYEAFAGTLRGIGTEISFGETGGFASAAIELGDSRDRKECSIPDGAAEIENSFKTTIEAGWEFDRVEFGAAAEFIPLTAKYDGGNADDRSSGGFLFTPYVKSGIPISGELITLGGELGATFMNSPYADAWYGVRQDADGTGGYSPDWGMESVYAQAVFTWLGIAPHVWLYMKYECRYLLGDAADSPLTKENFVHTGTVFMALRLRRR